RSSVARPDRAAPGPGYAQPSGNCGANDSAQSKVWVFLCDKGLQSPEETAAAIERVAQTYPARATERRRLRRTAPGLFDDRDIPVALDYRSAIEQTGAR